jgi:multimeric flavodoxin WrbA
MNVIALNGSARGKKGVTWRLLDSLLKGLSEGGANVRNFQLKDMNISYCQACLRCMHKTPDQCAQRDDMDQLYPFLKRSDLFVIGTPVYRDSMSAQMKTVMGRCICGMEQINRPIVTREQYLEISAKYEGWARKSRGQTS